MARNLNLKKLYVIITFFSYLLITEKSVAQNSIISLEKIVPPSPEVSQLNKYVSTLTDLSTGTVSIEVPIYTIKTRNFQWPISLSYHASGIRVDEISSSVGLGWNLTGVGVVSRNIAGLPDEAINGFLNNGLPLKVTDFGQLNNSDQLAVIRTAMAGTDTEPDRFSFNFNGNSGTFYLHPTKGVVLQSESNLRIVFNGNNFKFTDEEGNTYYFNTYESSVAQNYIISDEGDPITGTGITETHSGITGWYLDRVISSDLTDTIDFIYSGTYFIQQQQEQYSFKVGQTGAYYEGVGCTVGLQQPSLKKSNQQNTRVTAPILREIIFKNGKLAFSYSQDRLDMRSGSNATGDQGRLVSVSIYSKNRGVYGLHQKAQLYQNYFVSENVPSSVYPYLGYRLRLDSVGIFDRNNIAMSKAFKMEYNPTKLPYRTSPSQDFWGFFNGASNTNLVPKRIIEWVENGNSSIYTIGTANRDPDASKMQACMLNKITYPTGGYTTLTFEPHKYFDTQVSPGNPTPTTVNHSITATPGQATHIAKLRFVNDGPSQTVNVNAFFKAYYGKSDTPPYARIRRVQNQNNFSNELLIQGTDPYNDRTEVRTYTLLANAEYEMEAYVHAGSYPVNEIWSTISLSRLTNGSGPVNTTYLRTIGGLRIKSKTDFLPDGGMAEREDYLYGTSGEGVPITPLGVMNREYRNIYDRAIARTTLGGCLECSVFTYRLYTDQSPYALSTINGNLVGYSRIEKLKVDNAGVPLSKEVVNYQIWTDDYDVYPGTDNFYMLSRNWQNGKLTKEETYRKEANGNFSLLQAKDFFYSDYKKDTVFNLDIFLKANSNCFEDLVDYTVYQGRKYTGKKMLTMTIASERFEKPDGSFALMVDTVHYQYSSYSSHNHPIKITSTGSGGKRLSEMHYYAEDMIGDLGDTGGGIYANMIQRGQTGQLVLKRETTNSVLTYESKINYSLFFNSFIKPSTFYFKIGAGSQVLSKQVSYFSDGNINSRVDLGTIETNYLWDYNGQYPVVEAKSAAQADIAYASFEAESKGNWNYSGSTVADVSAPTGKRVYRLGGGQLSKGALTAARRYVLTYWCKNGLPTVSGGSGSTVSGGQVLSSLGNWTQYSHTINGATTISISGSGDRYIDEVRLYPIEALMNTYTYDPLVGMTSQTDASGRTTWYDYDGFGRLWRIRDHFGNVIEEYRYNYRQ